MNEAVPTGSERAWDLEGVYDAEISPLVAEILAICKRVGMPMVATFQYAHDDDSGEDGFCTSALPIRPLDTCQTVVRASALIQGGGRPAPMLLTVRDLEGRVTSSEVIL